MIRIITVNSNILPFALRVSRFRRQEKCQLYIIVVIVGKSLSKETKQKYFVHSLWYSVAKQKTKWMALDEERHEITRAFSFTVPKKPPFDSTQGNTVRHRRIFLAATDILIRTIYTQHTHYSRHTYTQHFVALSNRKVNISTLSGRRWRRRRGAESRRYGGDGAVVVDSVQINL